MPFTLSSCFGWVCSSKSYHKCFWAFGEVTDWDFMKGTWHMETAYGNLLILRGKEKKWQWVMNFLKMLKKLNHSHLQNSWWSTLWLIWSQEVSNALHHLNDSKELDTNHMSTAHCRKIFFLLRKESVKSLPQPRNVESEGLSCNHTMKTTHKDYIS